MPSLGIAFNSEFTPTKTVPNGLGVVISILSLYHYDYCCFIPLWIFSSASIIKGLETMHNNGFMTFSH
jgi:hypothetical protein